MADLPEPPYPASVRAKGWRFELDYEQIEQSGTWNAATALALEGLPLARPFLLAVWYAAWKQVPCGSLPADDMDLAGAIGLPRTVFAEYRDVLMRGWWMAADGRLYHRVITERVEAMLMARDQRYRRHREAVLRAYGYACFYCGETEGHLTLDHVIPKSRGGAGEPGNLVPACRGCNSRKGARTPEEWRAS